MKIKELRKIVDTSPIKFVSAAVDHFAELVAVAEAAKKFLDTTGDGDNGPPVTWVDDWNALEERLERLEAVGE